MMRILQNAPAATAADPVDGDFSHGENVAIATAWATILEDELRLSGLKNLGFRH